ncbi:hypothetical protein BJX70DRAFT_404493 [Aspergillus crustosus]
MTVHAHSHLLRMPIEILFLILEQCDSNTTSIARLAQTCHLFHDISAKFLYKHLVLGNTQTKPFRRTIKSNPSIAKLVKSLTIHHHYTEPDNPADFRPRFLEASSPTIAHLTDLETLILKGCGPDSPHGDIASRRHHKRLYLAAYGKLHRLFLKSISSGMLSKLKTLTLNLSDSRLWHCEIEPFIFHPTLERLSILGAAVTFLQFLGFNHSTNLKSLELLCCDISPGTLNAILSVPKALQYLVFKGATRTLPVLPAYTRPERQPYVDAIAQQAESLTTLDLDFWLDLDDEHPPVDLTALVNLRDLAIRPRILDGVTYGQDEDEVEERPLEENRLPQSLTHLTLIDVDEPIPTLIQSMLVKILDQWSDEGDLPNLKAVEFVNVQPYGRMDDVPMDGNLPVRWRELGGGRALHWIVGARSMICRGIFRFRRVRRVRRRCVHI